MTALISCCVLLGYVIVKKISRSHCHSDSGCIECDTPAVEVQRENTTRIEKTEDLLKQLMLKIEPRVDTPHTPKKFKFPEEV